MFSPRDISSSLVVFLVALPFCLGIAVASGAPPVAGILGGVIGGIVVGLFGGAPLMISGPANGMIVISWEFISQYGFSLLLWVGLLAGLLQILAGVLRFGQLFRAVTPGVILGLLMGFAVAIFISQFHVMIGSSPEGSTFENLKLLPQHLKDLTHDQTKMSAALVGATTLLVLFTTEYFFAKRLKYIPAALVAVIAGTGLAQFLELDLVSVNLPSDFASDFTFLSFREIPLAQLLSGDVIKTAFLIAFVASAETLLCCTAVDQMHKGPRVKYNKELTAQGIANSLCGLVGGIPITGVVIRSSANIAAGAKSQFSNILHGVWLLLTILFFSSFLTYIPLCVLAAILLHAVTKLVKMEQLQKLWEDDRFGVMVFGATTIGILAFGVFEGVAFGLVLSALRLLKTFNELEVVVEDKNGWKTIQFIGSATFLRIPYIAGQLEQIEPQAKVRFDIDHLVHIDASVYRMLIDWNRQHHTSGGIVSPTVINLFSEVEMDKMRGPGSMPTSEPPKKIQTKSQPSGT